jgi:hypothetical protein
MQASLSAKNLLNTFNTMNFINNINQLHFSNPHTIINANYLLDNHLNNNDFLNEEGLPSMTPLLIRQNSYYISSINNNIGG